MTVVLFTPEEIEHHKWLLTAKRSEQLMEILQRFVATVPKNQKGATEVWRALRLLIVKVQKEEMLDQVLEESEYLTIV